MGVNISQKKYQARGSEYTPPKGFWTNGVVPDSLDAECSVLDIPLTLNYFTPWRKKGNVVLSAGVSSWVMLKENYWYKYKSNDPNLISWWGTENENKYWFSILNVSAAYEYKLNHQWSIAAGPYVNIPLKGVGHGQVKLTSFGLKAALRFTTYKPSKF